MSMRPFISINWTSPPAFRGLQYGMFAFFLFLYILRKVSVSISGEPDKAPHSAIPGLRLHCLHVFHGEGSYSSLNILTYINYCKQLHIIEGKIETFVRICTRCLLF